jgi:3'-5' exoribonuclease
LADRPYINQLEASQLIEGVFAVQNCQLGQTRTGKPFIKCLLGDKTGRTPGRMWNANEALFNRLPTNGFVKITGQTQPYQGELQIIINEIAAHEPTDAELGDLLPSTSKSIDKMFTEVVNYLQAIENESLKALAERYLEDGDLMDKFCQAPAAQTLHHAYLGGLLEHTLSLLNLADKVLPLYPNVNRDLVILGLFLHDLGKCSELTWREGFGYSDDGQLVGHVARGALWLEDKANACAEMGIKIPKALLANMHHIILSHHGEQQFGALKVPATPEAIMITHLDNLDAKLTMALAATREEATAGAKLGGHFTEKVWALGTRLYRPDPTTVPDDNGEAAPAETS